MTLLTEYVAAIQKNADRYKEAENYYKGENSESFASAKLAHVLRATGHRGSHNYCRVIVDAVLNRLEIANIVCDTQKAQAKATEVFENNELALEAYEIHRNALAYGDAYALVWPDAEGKIQISYNSPRTTALVYDPENPRKKLFAVKMWKVKADPLSMTRAQTRLNIYTEDAIHKYVTDTDEVVTEGTQWRGIGSEDNPFGEIPVFHFRTHRPYGKPEHFEAYGPQNDMNKLLATHMYTVDYQGAPQRYALAMQGEADAVDFGDDETEREQLNSLSGTPGSVWYMKGIHGMGEFKPADPNVFIDPVKYLKESMAALTDTPYHYLERGLSGVAGGESLRVSEAPLLKKVADRQTSFGTTWRELFMFILKIEGISARIEVKWDLVESMDALGQWDVMLKKINAGLSHRQALREAGYEETDIERIMAERAQEAQEGAYYQRDPQARVSTNDNETFQNRNGLTEGAKDNGGRGEQAAA